MNEPLTLAIETAQATGSVALGRGETVLASTALSKDKRDRKGEELMPAIKRLMDQAGYTPGDLERVFVSTGPGSFTGLRVGITVAKMLGQFGEVDIYPVPTLLATAWHANQQLVNEPDRELPMVVALAVKDKTVYGDYFQFQNGAPIDCEAKGRLVDLAELITDDRQQLVVEWPQRLPDIFGDQWEKVQETLIVRDQSVAVLAAGSVYELSQWLLSKQAMEAIDPMALTPSYIRPPEAVTLWDARHGKDDKES